MLWDRFSAILTGYREYRVGEDEYALPASDGAQQITYEMALNRQVWYYYRDASGFYTLSERLAKEPFEFTVRRIEQPAGDAGQADID